MGVYGDEVHSPHERTRKIQMQYSPWYNGLQFVADNFVERFGRQTQQKTDHDRRGALSRELHIGQQVMARNLRQGVPWVAGMTIERLSSLTYLLQVDTGQLWKHHLDLNK